MKKLRRFLVIGVMVLSVLAMSGIVAAPKTNAAASAGDLIKMSGLSSVYYLGSDGKRYVFPNSTTYFSWYTDFSGVVTVSASELQSYPIGGNVTMRAGTKLVKITTDPSVYAVQPNGVLVKIQSEAQAAALYGTNWSKRVVDVPDAFFVNYKIGTPLPDGNIPAGSLVKNANVATIYYYDGTNYRQIATEAAFNANMFSFANVITTTNTITAGGNQITGAEFVNVAQNGGSGIVVTGSGLMVSLNANTAPSATLIASQASANLASFNFTAANDGPVTVNSVKIHRVGLSSDSYLDNVYLYNGTTKLTDAGSVSGGYVTFSNSTGLFTVNAGATLTITVRADVDAINATSGNIAMAINAASDITSTGANVSGSFPITGNTMSLIAKPADLASAAFGVVTIPANVTTNTIQAGTMGATVWTAPLQINQKSVALNYISFRQVGSINSDALQNLKLYVNGVQAGSAASIDSNNRVTFDLSASPVTLQTGQSTLELRADIVKGSSRTYSFNLQLASDVLLTDTNYGVNITPANAGTGYYGIGTVQQTTISAGSLSIAADPAFTANQVVKSASSVVLAQYTIKAYGEDMQVNNIVINPVIATTQTTSTNSAEGINNLALFVNGAQVGSSQNYNYSLSGSTITWPSTKPSFGTNNLFTIPAGTTVTLQVKGDLNQSGTSYLSSIQANIQSVASQGVSSVMSANYGVTTANQTLSITAGNLTVAANNAFGSQYVVQNTQAQKIASFILQTGSAEGVTINSINVGLAATGTALTNLANLYISDNTTPTQPQANNNFNANFTIQSNSSHQVDVYADLGTIATGTTIQANLTVTATGASTHSTTLANGTGNAVYGQTMTVSSGSLSVPTLVTNDPVSQLVLGGSTQQIAKYNFVSQNGSVNISELWFNVTANSTSSLNTSDVVSVSVNGSSASVIGGAAHITGLNLTVPAGFSGLNVPVIATFANVTSVNQGGVRMGDVARLVLSDYKYTVGSTTKYGNNGTATLGNASVDVASNLSVLAASVPTVVLASDNTTGVSTGYTGGLASELMRFSVSNGGTNSINLKQITITPVYSAGAITNTTTQKIYVYDKNDLNTPLNGASGTAIGNSNTAVNIPFTNVSTIGGNNQEEYVVKADTQGSYTTGVGIQLQLTAANDTAPANAGGVATGDWLWNDSTVANTAFLNGYLVKNLPLTGNLFVH